VVSGGESAPANSAETVDRGPLGPRQDPVFPSLSSAGPLANENIDAYDTEPVTVAAVPLARNIFTLTPIPIGLSRGDLIEEAQRLADAPAEQRLGAFDQPEKDRVFQVASLFVQGHARRISKGFAIKTPHPDFAVGTIVISEDLIPRTRLRHAALQWAITSSGVVQLKNVRLPVGHLEPIHLADQPELSSPHRGDGSDVAFLLAFVCDLLGLLPETSVAGIGVVALQDSHLLVEPDIEPLLEGAKNDNIAHVILPFADGKVNGEHGGVHYWSARDCNEAIFCLLTALARQSVVPNLYRRAMTKEAYSWLSLMLILLSICGFQLAVAFGSHPPVEFVRFLLGVVGLLFVGSLIFTHRYWRLDR